MTKKAINNLPKWYNDKTNKYHTILTDDIDSLLSCTILKEVMGWDIKEVFLLRQVANYSDIPIDVSAKTKNATVTEDIGVDFAKYKGKCFDNHITRFSDKDYKNEESINPNLMEDVTKKNYTEKYAGSTVLLLWSLYGLSKDMTDEAMMLLLTIDSSFLGYYDDRYRPYIKHYLVDVLDLPEFYNCIERHTQEDFRRIRNKYHLIVISCDNIHCCFEMSWISIKFMTDCVHHTGIITQFSEQPIYSNNCFKRHYLIHINKYICEIISIILI